MRTLFLVIAAVLAFPPAALAQKVEPRFYRQVRVLCVGIENYQRRGIGPARYSVNDAEKLGELFEKTYGFEVEYLLGKDATARAITDKLGELCERATDKDAVIVFFAGHGIAFDSSPKDRHGFLVPYDADVSLDRPEDTPLAKWQAACLDMQKVVDQVQRCKARHAVIIADACCSGYMARHRDRGSLETDIALRLLLREKGRTVLSATTDNQGARWIEKDKEGRPIHHGVFTHALIEKLRLYNREPASISDIAHQLRMEIPNKTEGGMQPQMLPLGEGNGEFVFLPLFLTREEVKIVEAELEGTRRRSERTRGLFDRLLERQKWRATVQDVLEASRAYLCHYDFSDDPAKLEAAWKERVRRLTANAALGDPLAMAALHYCHAHKIGVEAKDEKLALHYARLAYSTEHPAGLHVMARCYVLGLGGLSKNRPAYDRLTKDAAEGGFPLSQYNLGLELEASGKSREAQEKFLKAVRGGHHAARPKAADGILYARAIEADKERDKDKGNAIMKKACQDAAEFMGEGVKAGCPICAYHLADLHGRYPEFLDRKEALGYLRRSARAGHGAAQVILARELAPDWWMIEEDRPLNLGLKPNHVEARKWADLAAMQDLAEAHLVLANLYRFGSTQPRIPADWDEAAKHCKQAAELKHPCAYVLLSYWHLHGTVVAKRPDPNEAFRLAAQACASKNDRAYLWMGDLYWGQRVPVERLPPRDRLPTGEGVMKHHGLHYYTLAATSGKGEVASYYGIQAAKTRLKEIRKQLENELIQNHNKFVQRNKKKPMPADIQPGYYRRFLEVYPEDAKLFRQLTAHPAKEP